MLIIDVRIELNLQLLHDLIINGLSIEGDSNRDSESIVHGARISAKSLTQVFEKLT